MKAIVTLFAIALIVWLARSIIHKPRAHDPYTEWKDKRGYGCCHDRDCRPVRADLTEAGWRVWIDGRWVLVPPDAVLKIPSPDGRSHACISPGAVEPMCFVPGEARS